MAQEAARPQGTAANGGLPPTRSTGMIPKSGNRFSDEIMPRQVYLPSSTIEIDGT